MARGNLTDEQIKEIEVWKYRRKKYHITVGIIAHWNNFHPQHLYAVERHIYPMSPLVRKAYKKTIKVFARNIIPDVKYEKRSEKE